MKKVFSLITSLIMVISMVSVLPVMSASAETYGDYYYNILDDETIEITSYNGSASTLSIPSTIDGTDTNSVAINRAYRSIIAGMQKIVADDGKAFLIGKLLNVPEYMIEGMKAHFTLGEYIYERTP